MWMHSKPPRLIWPPPIPGKNALDIGNNKFAYFDGSGNLQVVVIPEANSGILILMGLAFFFAWKTRKLKSAPVMLALSSERHRIH